MEGTILMVERSGRENLRVDGVGTGAFLLAFRVDEGNHAEQEKRLLGLGGRVESRTEFTSYCRDPEGNRLAFSHYPTPRNP